MVGSMFAIRRHSRDVLLARSVVNSSFCAPSPLSSLSVSELFSCFASSGEVDILLEV